MRDLEIIKKSFYWCFNYTNPSEWIEYVAEGRNIMYDHFTEKWNKYHALYKDSALAFLALFCSMSDNYQERLCEYIMKNYISKENSGR